MGTDITTELEELLHRLRGPEGLDFEAKEAHGSIPRSLWETASAFANTDGGIIVLGLQERPDGLVIRGVARPEAMKLDLHTHFRNRERISREVAGKNDINIEAIAGKHLVVVRIDPVPRTQRPVFVGKNRDEAYVRRDSGDFLCSTEELDRMRREASNDPLDARVIPYLNLDDFDHAAIGRYRDLMIAAHPHLPHLEAAGVEFLCAINAWRADRELGVEGPTYAGILMFGTDAAIREIRPIHVIDYRRVPHNQTAQRRWIDRVRWTGHLFGAWEEVFPRLTRGLPVPFHLQDVQRVDRQAGRETLREAFVNLLVHTDYQEASDAIILHMDDGYTFYNPGNSRLHPSRFLTSSIRSERRNPTIADLFHYAGLADQAGSGFIRIFNEWTSLGYRRPQIRTGGGLYEFELDLRLVNLISTVDRQWLSEIGEHWSEAEELALIVARHEGGIDNQTLRRLTGKDSLETSRVLTRLRDRDYLIMHAGGRNTLYELGPAAKRWKSPQNRGEQLSLLSNDVSIPNNVSTTIPNNESSMPNSESSMLNNAESPPFRESQMTTIPDEVWSELLRIAEPLRKRQRSSSTAMRDDIVVRLCQVTPLAIRELEVLVGRGVQLVRQVTGALIEQQRLFYVYPNHPKHPHQRYTSRPVEQANEESGE